MKFFAAIVLAICACGLPARAAEPTTAPSGQALYDRVTPSLVAVQFTWNYEFGRVDVVGPGIVVSSDGLILLPGEVVGSVLPDEQLRDFKIIVPTPDKDDEELDAVFQGRDERNNVAFVKAAPSVKHEWRPIKFMDHTPDIGEPVESVGMLAKSAGYRTYLTQANIAAHIRGEFPQILVSGGLGPIGAVVFDRDGNAIGLVNSPQFNLQPLLHHSGGREDVNPMAPLAIPPHLYTPTAEFAQALSDPPTPDKPIVLGWLGIPQLSGISKDVAQIFGLENQPAAEVGDIVENSPAAKAGLKVGMKIVKVDGQPLQRGDEPSEVPDILRRKLIRLPVGTTVTLGVLTEPGKPLQDIKVTLEPRPKPSNKAKRYYNDDLGFGVREVVFEDAYRRKKPADLPGVVVTITKPSGAAQTAKLQPEDLIAELDNQPVTDLEEFKKAYEAIRKDKPKDAVVMVVVRPDGTNETIRIEPPQ